MFDALIGRRLGIYEIRSDLGRGGMARVYKAWDTTLKRPVAIKVIEPGLSHQEQYRERFEREAQAVAALEHPHIVPVYFFDKTDNLYFIAMKFIEGEDLATLMNRYASAAEYLPEADILRIIDGITQALDYAHVNGVIHRDVKPSNIMIDKDGHAYLTDFGLALAVDKGTVGEVLGTPHYVSPEQARNSGEAVPHSDLYSLGIVLYELFAGVLPFDDPNPTAIALQHIMNQPVEPRVFNPDLSPQVEAVILKAIAKEPAQRQQSGRELYLALQTALKQAAEDDKDMPIAPLPPVPPGIETPPPRHPSTRPVSAEVRASLAQRSAVATPMQTLSTREPTREQTAGSATADTVVATKPAIGPLLVLGAVILGVLAIVTVVALSLSNSPTTIADLPTATIIEPTNTAIPTTETTAIIAAQVAVASPTPITTDTPTIQPPSPTPLPTDVPPTSTPLPPTETSLPPTATSTIAPTIAPPTVEAVVLAGPTAAPNDWLPVRFIYDADAFYWLNDANRSISSETIAFERMNGSNRFDGNRLSFWTIERGRCIALVFADVSRGSCPENRRPNAWFTPTRTQGVDFWTGSGQFRVLWNNEIIAVCEIAAGECIAAVPPR